MECHLQCSSQPTITTIDTVSTFEGLHQDRKIFFYYCAVVNVLFGVCNNYNKLLLLYTELNNLHIANYNKLLLLLYTELNNLHIALPFH